MNFTKTYQKIIHPETESYFSIRQYDFSEENADSTKVLQEFMKSKYFLWQEEFRNKILVNIKGNETYVDWNFHGLYDVKKLNPLDFDKVDFKTFKARFKTFIEKQIGQDSKLPEIQQTITALYSLKSQFYVIKNLPDANLHKWSVYDFFISGIAINIDNKTITLTEFGLD